MRKHLEKGNTKLLNAWAFYDWANSVYSLVIASAVFPIFYGALFSMKGVDEIAFMGRVWEKTSLVFGTTAVAFAIVAVISPLLSGIADFLGNKKFFLKFFCYLGAFSTMALAWFSLENLGVSLLFYLLALVGFWGSLVFYNSYLPDIAHPEQHDSISAKGFSLGYFGSVLLLVVILVMVMKPELFGFDLSVAQSVLDNGSEEEISAATKEAQDAASFKAMKLSFILTGVWWIGFSQYTYYHLPRGNKSEEKLTKDVVFQGFNELKGIWNAMKPQLRLKKYLIAFFVYSMAVQTVMLSATYFGEQELDWGGEDEKTFGLIISILLIQIIAILGAFLTSKLSAKIGNLKTLIVINSIWIVICAWAYFVHSPVQFYATAAVVGLVMGGIQSLSRSTYAKFLPETEDTTSYFSFYDVAEKIGIIIGMGIFLLMQEITGSMRYSIMFLILFFLIGVLLLRKVPVQRSSAV